MVTWLEDIARTPTEAELWRRIDAPLKRALCRDATGNVSPCTEDDAQSTGNNLDGAIAMAIENSKTTREKLHNNRDTRLSQQPPSRNAQFLNWCFTMARHTSTNDNIHFGAIANDKGRTKGRRACARNLQM